MTILYPRALVSAATMKLWERQAELGQAWQRIAQMGFPENSIAIISMVK